jgi:hypothetical protein
VLRLLAADDRRSGLGVVGGSGDEDGLGAGADHLGAAAAAALGAYHWYMNHQRRMYTLVSHVRGPEQPITFAGAPIKAIIPTAVGEAGNITVSFEVLSYAGTVAITAIADRDHFPDLSTLTDALQVELALLTNETADTAADPPIDVPSRQPQARTLGRAGDPNCPSTC